MPQIPNAPGTRYAFRTCVDSKAPELITEMQQGGWVLDSWSPLELCDRGGGHEAVMLLAFTRHDAEQAKLINFQPILRELRETREVWKAKGPGDPTAPGIVTGLSAAITMLEAATGAGAGEPPASQPTELYACVPPHGWDTAMEELCADWETRNVHNRHKPSRTDAYRDGFHDGAIWGAETPLVVKHAVHELKRLRRGAVESANLTIDASDPHARDNRFIAQGHVTAYDQALELLGVKPGG
jgi:hypothetical protein